MQEIEFFRVFQTTKDNLTQMTATFYLSGMADDMSHQKKCGISVAWAQNYAKSCRAELSK